MTSPLAVVTAAINVVVRPRTKLPKPAPGKAINFHECLDDGRLMLEQLHEDAAQLSGRHRTLRFFAICSADSDQSSRRVARKLLHGCGFHRSAVIPDSTVDPSVTAEAINEQLEVLRECNPRIGYTTVHIHDVHRREDDEASEVVVSYLTFTLELKRS